MWCWWVFRLWKLQMQKKKIVNKLVDECTKTIEEVKLARIILAENENSYKCSLCTVYTALLWIVFAINVGRISAGLVYFYWYLKKMLHVLTLILTKKQQFTKQINGGNPANKY